MSEESAPKQFRTFAPFTDEELEALDVAHGDVRVVRGATPEAKRWKPDVAPEPPWECVFRAPTSGEAAFFERALHKDTKDMALRNHAKATVVGVSFNGKKTMALDANGGVVLAANGAPLRFKEVRDAFDVMRERFGLAHIACSDALMSLSGMVSEDEGKE